VSGLSPYLRHRIVTETEVARTVLAQHRAAAAEKFIDELCWRAYWKGWLEMRPSVWARYARDVTALRSEAGEDAALAMAGRTGIDCFDAWASELVTTGYLHNHARMWFASIWVFTLRLPWQLGADFFLRQLLDGDAAANTLSWRWVAGLHTPGKTYLARADNIARYTEGRFDPVGLATFADPVAGWANPDPAPLPAEVALPQGRVGLLITDDDLAPDADWLNLGQFAATAMLDGVGEAAPLVELWRAEARDNAAIRLKPDVRVTDVGAVAAWANEARLDAIVTPYAPVGPVRDALAAATLPVPLIHHRRAWDRAAWPLARGGFFGLKKKIPAVLATLDAPARQSTMGPDASSG
jgi:deoxyribodipyrimidine photo-lyase